MKKSILIIAIILLASSCLARTVIPVELECPPPLMLPTHTTEQALEMNFLSAGSYIVIVERDRLLKERVKHLCSIIESTQ